VVECSRLLRWDKRGMEMKDTSVCLDDVDGDRLNEF
jgi:hypothetical protein